MSFIIIGKIIDQGHCRIPQHFLTAVDVATNRVLASTQIAEGTEVEFRLEYDRTKLNLPNEPHEVLLVGTKDPLKKDRLEIAALTKLGQGLGIEDRIIAPEWVIEGENFLIPNRIIIVDCCCILWALFGVYTVTGTVLHDPTGLPLPGVTVEAQDWDPSFSHDLLGSAVTDAAGRFTILVPVATFIGEDAPLNRPDLRFSVTIPDGTGKRCKCLDFEDDIIRFNWPNCKRVILRVPCCLAIIERVGGWAAHFDPTVPSIATHPPFPSGRGIDSAAARAQGLNFDWSSGPAEDSPFGGQVTLCGATTCKDGKKFRFSVAKWSDEITPPADADFVPITTTFSEMVYGGISFECLPPPFDFICFPVVTKTSVSRIPDAEGFYDILPNTESGCLFVPWHTNVPAFPDGKYSILLTIRDEDGCEFRSSMVNIRLDNTRPDAELTVSVPDCATIRIGDTVTGTLTGTDANFHSYQLVFEGDGVSGVLAQRTYTGIGDIGDVGVAWSWNTSGLPACGYRLVLRVWDRTIVNNVRPEGEIQFAHEVAIVKYYCLGEG
jgi:hypothetical protein